MKITRATKWCLKFMRAKKRALLYEIRDEYSRLAKIFINQFWDKSYIQYDLKKEIINLEGELRGDKTKKSRKYPAQKARVKNL